MTYAKCFVPLDVVLRKLTDEHTVRGVGGVVESHNDNTPHVHMCVQRSRTKMRPEHLIVEHDGVAYRLNIVVLTTARHQLNWYGYLHNAGTPQSAEILQYRLMVEGGSAHR